MKLPHTVAVLRPKYTQDVYGNTQVRSWVDVKDINERGFFQPRDGSEDEKDGDRQEAEAVLYLASGSVVDGTCRVRYDGQVFEVVGPPEAWRKGSALDHKKALLRRVTGA